MPMRAHTPPRMRPFAPLQISRTTNPNMSRRPRLYRWPRRLDFSDMMEGIPATRVFEAQPRPVYAVYNPFKTTHFHYHTLDIDEARTKCFDERARQVYPEGKTCDCVFVVSIDERMRGVQHMEAEEAIFYKISIL